MDEGESDGGKCVVRSVVGGARSSSSWAQRPDETARFRRPGSRRIVGADRACLAVARRTSETDPPPPMQDLILKPGPALVARSWQTDDVHENGHFRKTFRAAAR